VSQLDAHGIAVDVPSGWEARIFRRNAAGETRASEVAGPPAPMGELTFPVAQLATVPLPVDAADYGSDVVATLGPNDAFIVLKEFGPGSIDKPLFARTGMPRALDTEDFDPAALQRALNGQAGRQVFFREAGRAFCLYVVLGSYQRRNQVVPQVNQLLASIRIGQASPTP
jgi:hypothetical protein